mmetsp:Transcript_10923/g.33844  ORF Transcript_10923/g.33844 Transcript_10923/m.33844 type:complete len:257 (+) Transcript_10923:308-1078(+)
MHGRLEVAKLAAAGGHEHVVGLHVQMGKALLVHVDQRTDQVAQQLHGGAAGLVRQPPRHGTLRAVLEEHVQLVRPVDQPHQLQDARVAQLLEDSRLMEVLPDLAQQLPVQHPLHHNAMLAGPPLGHMDALEGTAHQQLRHGVGGGIYEWALEALSALEDLPSKGFVPSLLHHELAQVQAILRALCWELRHLLKVPLLVRAGHQEHIFFAVLFSVEVDGARADVAQHHEAERLGGVVGAEAVLCGGPMQREFARSEL